MDIEFIAGFAVIAPDAATSRGLYVDTLGLPLEASPASDYFHSEQIGGARHFGVWPLTEAAQACFGEPAWPKDVTVPQASVEFEVADVAAVASAAAAPPPPGLELVPDPPRGARGETRAPPPSAPGPIRRLSLPPRV